MVMVSVASTGVSMVVTASLTNEQCSFWSAASTVASDKPAVASWSKSLKAEWSQLATTPSKDFDAA